MIKNPGSVLNVEEVSIGPLEWQFKPLTVNDDNKGFCTVPAHHKLHIKADNVWNDPEADHLDTVLHEILHAISMMYLVEENALTEIQVEHLGTALERFFISNPKFNNWLVQYSGWQRQELIKIYNKKTNKKVKK